MTKKCNGKCGLIKDITEFVKGGKNDDGSQKYKDLCKTCQNQLNKEAYKINKETILNQRKEYYKNNKDKHLKKCKEYHQTNKEKILDQHKEYRSSEEGKQIRKEYNSSEEGKQQRRNYENTKRKEDINYKLRKSFSNRLYQSLKSGKANIHWEQIVGYTLEDLKQHLESKFDSNMNWDNYGVYWHIDHKVPVAAFNYTSYMDEAFKKCWSLENLQPLKSEDNLRKYNTISEEWNNVELAAQLL